MNRQYKQMNPQAGVSLIEILVAVIVLAIGMLGMAAMQSTSVKFSYESYLRTQGTFLSYDLMDRIRANPGEIYQLATNDTPAQSTCAGVAANCTPRDLAQADLYAWYQNAIDVFPNATYELDHDDGEYSLRITFENRYENDDVDGETEQFVYNFEAD